MQGLYLFSGGKMLFNNQLIEFSAEAGTVGFPRDVRGTDWSGGVRISLKAQEAALDCRIDAIASGQLEGLQGGLARHLDRFSFREAPLQFDWNNS